MNGFIKNNKEILITLFCLWIGVVFTFISIKLSNINKELSAIEGKLYFNIDELGNLRELKNISSEIKNLNKYNGFKGL